MEEEEEVFLAVEEEVFFEAEALEEVFFAEALLEASIREAWVTPVALAICRSWAWVGTSSPLSALPISEAVIPSTFSARAVWVSFASARASFKRSDNFFAMITSMKE